MPVRIYDIAKKLGVESKEVLAKAKELGIAAARVPSSSLDKITAEYLEQLLGAEIAARPRPPAKAAPAPEIRPVTEAPPEQKIEVAPPTGTPPSVSPAVPEVVAPHPPVLIVAPVVPLEPPPLAAAAAPETTVEASRSEIPPPERATEEKTEPPAAPAVVQAPVGEISPVTSAIMPPVGPSAVPETVIGLPAIKIVTAPPLPPPPLEPPAPPPPPPPPRVGDKVGFIQLPVKPTPKVGEKAGTPKFPPRPGARPEVSRPGVRPDFRQQRTGSPAGRFTQPAAGTRPGSPVTAAVRPGPGKTGPVTAPFVPPASGETITMKPPIVVRLLAELLKCKPFQLIRDLMELGVFANVNQTIEEGVAQRLCSKYGFRFEVEKREKGAGIVHAPIRKQEADPDDKVEDLRPRPPVVTIMGHVDHGKTTLLDVIRKSNVAAGEAGGITQHIGAYTISFPHPERPKEVQQITFLDTPGHAAFSAMRARGANVTDIVVLVVAANDGVMPQTEEAISHAAAAKVPIIVAVNKCDHPNANAMRVRQQLQEQGLVCEEWGGNTIFQDLSALTKQGVDKLLELILLQAEIMELKANPLRRAKGNVIESGLEPGGPTATVLVRKGTLKVGDIILCGQFWGKARALINEEGQRLKSAGPSVAVKLLGLNGVPEAGLEFAVVENEKMAREIASDRAEKVRERSSEDRLKPKATLADLLKTLETSAVKALRIVIRGDTQGSVEAIVEALKKIESDKVTLEILQGAVGIITEADVNLASASKAIVIGFHTRVDSGAVDAAKREGVQIKLYSIIYELIDEVKNAMAGLLEPLSREVVLGAAEVRQIFSLSKGGNVAGCMVSNGRLVKGRCRIMRRKDLIYEGLISSLRRFQDEVQEVRAGLECGVRIDGFNEYHTGDSIECYSTEKIAQKL